MAAGDRRIRKVFIVRPHILEIMQPMIPVDHVPFPVANPLVDCGHTLGGWSAIGFGPPNVGLVG